MKQVISKHTNQIPTINPRDINFKINIVAIEAGLCTGGKEKYILAPLAENSGFKYGFVNGKRRWQSAETLQDLMKAVLSDVRVKVYVFNDTKELGNWLLTK